MTASPVLEVRGLSRAFGARAAVSQLELTVYEGDVYGFLGPNGAGKTTAMRCMMGLLRPSAGEVRILGDAHPTRARAGVGAIIESPAFHDWLSGRENLSLAAAYRGLDDRTAAAEIDRVLDRVGLAERSKDKAGAYSLGMRQRLAIARALLGKPRLLLLDEPTNGLDPRGMKEMRELIRSLALHDQLTVFVSSHLLSEVQAMCNRVGVLHQGRLQAEGDVAELVRASGEGAQVIEVGGPEVDALRAALAPLAGVSVEGAGAAGRIRVRLAAGVPAASVAAAVVGAGLPLEALVPAQRNLEDVFMELTR